MTKHKTIALAIHGGAGTIDPQSMTPEKEKAYKTGLENAVIAGKTVLEQGGTAVEAVEAAVCSLEDCILFNAGKGAVFTSEGKIELDASIMRGNDLEAGAACGIIGVKNPVKLARSIMEKSQHILFAGHGANAFAENEKLEIMPQSYFHSDFRWQQLQEVMGSEEIMLDHNAPKPIGTVGAVALDQYGNLAAATSTGGMTNKKFGRVGDTPIIGAGTYANNQTCAVSCTGHGEFFMKTAAAFNVHSRMDLLNENVEKASEHVINQVLLPIGGEGGLIAIDGQGNIAMPFNSGGMYRGKWKIDEEIITAIYND